LFWEAIATSDNVKTTSAAAAAAAAETEAQVHGAPPTATHSKPTTPTATIINKTLSAEHDMVSFVVWLFVCFFVFQIIDSHSFKHSF
jgi:hypothetical protein